MFGWGLVRQHIGLRIENRRKREGKYGRLVEGKSSEESDELGGKRPEFMYTPYDLCLLFAS